MGDEDRVNMQIDIERKGKGRQLARDYMPLRFQCSHRALQHVSTVVYWLTQVTQAPYAHRLPNKLLNPAQMRSMPREELFTIVT